MPIRALPPLLVNQIAAGEVIERPASVVKELVENSIDAGASQIDVTAEQGGRELIAVRDDGCGIPLDQLTLALAPHATSKIESPQDLDAIATLGFRGEALASITSVARVTLVSRCATEAQGGRIEAEGEQISAPAPFGAPPGTTITVRNLFFNTPVRRKFLRTEQTEANHIAEAVRRLALSHSAIGFSLTHNGRRILDLERADYPRDRILAVIGRELAPELLEITAGHETARGPIELWGMIGTPSIARGTAAHMNVFINGRFVRDRTVHHALREAYRGLLDPTRYPTVILYLEMLPAMLDVNVHPAKAEVRFRDAQAVHGFVLSALRERLLAADLTPQPGSTAGSQWRFESPFRPPQGRESFSFDDAGTRADATVETSRAEIGRFVDHFRQMPPQEKGFVYEEVRRAIEAETGRSLPEPSLGGRRVDRILQVHNSYIVVEDDEGLEIIDQHALHERVMFEDLKARILQGTLESQRMLVPVLIEGVDSTIIDSLDDLAPLLSRLGIEATALSENSLAIHAFPSFLFERRVDPEIFVRELLDKLTHNDGRIPEDEAALHEVLDVMSCKAAVKAGDRLTDEEIDALLRRRRDIERSGSCPHGRPTAIRLPLSELERQFGRR